VSVAPTLIFSYIYAICSKEVALDMVNMNEKQQFMDGEKHIAIISEAGSAGVSLHAERRVNNQVWFSPLLIHTILQHICYRNAPYPA
jgi:hypothetical protein